MPYLLGKHPFVTLKVKVPEKGWVVRRCLIDTGFSGGITLPDELKDYFPINKLVETHFTLADDSEVTVDSIPVNIEYEKHRKEILAIFMGTKESLVGIEFLDQMKFCLNLREKKVELS